MVGAADSECEGIGRVFGLRDVWEAEQRLNHFLNLVLACTAMTHNGEFCLFWGKFIDGDRFPSSG